MAEADLPQLRWFPSLPPRSDSAASKLLNVFNPVTTVAVVMARRLAATQRPASVDTLPNRRKLAVHATTPA